MAGVVDIYELLGEAYGQPAAAIEPYGSTLRSLGHLPKTKRGRGATPITPSGASSLLIASLFPGAQHLGVRDPLLGCTAFLNYANLEIRPSAAQSPLVEKVAQRLGIEGERRFHDWVHALLNLYISGNVSEVIGFEPSPAGQLEPWVYDGPWLEVAIQGPFPIGTIKFRASPALAGTNEANVILPFLSPIYSWSEGALGEENASTKYAELASELRRLSSRGKKTITEVDGRVFEIVARAFRDTS